jgi:hypothetical protein
MDPALPDGAATVTGLSERAACLILPCPAEPGAILRLLLSNEAHLCAREASLRVTNRRGLPGGPWRVGGELVEPLPQDALRALLA